VPGSDGKGRPILLADAIQRTLTRKEPHYTRKQVAAFKRFSKARNEAAAIITGMSDINNVWALRTDDNPVSFHPRLSRDYSEILAGAGPDAEMVTETDLFFLSVKALRTLPVGGTLAQTLELGTTKEGIALRSRVAELYGELRSGATDLATLATRIDEDADNYRALTARLRSPNLLSGFTDVALSGAGLFPIIGTIASSLSLAKSAWSTTSTIPTRMRLKSMAWGAYQGRAI
jgi:hypothetical protein